MARARGIEPLSAVLETAILIIILYPYEKVMAFGLRIALKTLLASAECSTTELSKHTFMG